MPFKLKWLYIYYYGKDKKMALYRLGISEESYNIRSSDMEKLETIARNQLICELAGIEY